ncbi:helix-turn-helix domain-containing protein [Sphingomonas montanisoli]|uniref:Helix-turn-helix domain-containing protein n=1 Tax=Sphingomonas montanisoli TaxID=2606412 RepID=A0A5D9C4S1_9SPHN|nr:helix-turn-helix domain-containing protein [Sphingomonas montanisoli]TZG26473.1 helix-turn-helix domain-containing protein [Sphingomonas montanisoli]
MTGQLLTSAEAAEQLRVCEKVLRRLRKAGAIRYVALGERKIMYRPEDCADYLASRVRREEPCQPAQPPKGRPVRHQPGVIIPFSQRDRARA